MAKNRVQEGKHLTVPFAGAVSGAPVCVGQITGVALANTDTDGNVVIDTHDVYKLSVKGIDGVGNSAVAIGDAIYYNAADIPKLNKKNAGVLFGYALGTVAAGATADIPVKQKY